MVWISCTPISTAVVVRRSPERAARPVGRQPRHVPDDGDRAVIAQIGGAGDLADRRICRCPCAPAHGGIGRPPWLAGDQRGVAGDQRPGGPLDVGGLGRDRGGQPRDCCRRRDRWARRDTQPRLEVDDHLVDRRRERHLGSGHEGRNALVGDSGDVDGGVRPDVDELVLPVAHAEEDRRYLARCRIDDRRLTEPDAAEVGPIDQRPRRTRAGPRRLRHTPIDRPDHPSRNLSLPTSTGISRVACSAGTSGSDRTRPVRSVRQNASSATRPVGTDSLAQDARAAICSPTRQTPSSRKRLVLVPELQHLVVDDGRQSIRSVRTQHGPGVVHAEDGGRLGRRRHADRLGARSTNRVGRSRSTGLLPPFLSQVRATWRVSVLGRL